ncbi:MAG: class I SAM-dependent methyltransferase [Acidobacteriota bacterium]
MTDHTQRFTGRVADYEQYRERYDASIILPRLRDWCGLAPNWLIADIGAGTGMLADVFLANHNPVLAIEPNPGMREACASAHASRPLLTIVDGSAEASTLDNHSVDLVTAGRALHWFDFDRSFAEFHRILKPHGWFVSIAFGRAGDGRAENVAIEDLLSSMNPNRVGTREAYAAYARLPQVLPRDYHHEEIAGEMHLTWPELFGLIRSISHAPLPTDPRFSAFERNLRDVFERYAANDRLTLTTKYWINAGRF